MPEGMYLDGANTTQREAMGLPIMAFNPDGEPVDIFNHYVNFGWEYVYHCHILSHEEMDMMHAQVVGIAPNAPTVISSPPYATTGNGRDKANVVQWTDNSKNETGFVIERSTSSTGPWTWRATVMWSLNPNEPDSDFANMEGTGTRTYNDVIGNDKTVYYYNVYAINTVGDTWDYSNPAFNNIPPGGGWPTLTLDSRGAEGPVDVLEAPSDLTGSAVVKNKKTATVTLIWMDNATSETGFLIQRAYDAAFTSGVVNTTIAADTTTFDENVARGVTFYYRVHAFSDTTQSAWSNTATVITP